MIKQEVNYYLNRQSMHCTIFLPDEEKDDKDGMILFNSFKAVKLAVLF